MTVLRTQGVTPDRIGTPLVEGNHGQMNPCGPNLWQSQQEPTHVALSLDPQKRAELREAICEAVNAIIDDEEAVDVAFAVEALLLGSGDGS